jgi:hypothetical protein
MQQQAALAGDGDSLLSEKGNISYPALNTSTNAGVGGTTVTVPAAVMTTSGGGYKPLLASSPPRMSGGIGYATSSYQSGTTAGGQSNSTGGFMLRSPPGRKLSLFPSPNGSEASRSPTSSQDGSEDSESDSGEPANRKSVVTFDPAAADSQRKSVGASSTRPPSLNMWLRNGTVSPFGPLSKTDKTTEKGKGLGNWPLNKLR